MKGHKFKLSGLLKVRKIAEDVCKVELGKIQVEISKVKKSITKHSEDISSSYKEQEERLDRGISSQEIKAFPLFISEKKRIIEQLNQKLSFLENELKSKIRELAQKQADVKLINQMKEKSLIKYKKQVNKKMAENLEEQVQNWMSIKDVI